MQAGKAFTATTKLIELDLKRILHQLAKLSKILINIPVDKNLILQEAQKAALARAAYSSALNNAACQKLSAEQIFNQVQNDLSLHNEIKRYQELENHLIRVYEKASSADILGEVCRYFELTTNDINLFAFDGSNLFSREGSSGKEKQVQEIFAYLDAPDGPHHLIKSWVLHLELIRISPFKEGNDKAARAVQGFYLHRNHLSLGGFVHLPLELYDQKREYYTLIRESLSSSNYSAWIRYGLQMYQANLNRIEGILKNLYRISIDYNAMPPRQRNQINYIFDRAFEYNLPSDIRLSARQQKIMNHILTKGSVSSGEMSDIFQLNRKTIQRDFNELMEYRLVNTSGNGSSLKYNLNMKNREVPEMEALQTIVTEGRNAAAPYLFEEYSETKPVFQQALLF